MRERSAYLRSLHHYNFRHGKESPRVIGVVNYKPIGVSERPCFKVEYESDNEIGFVPIATLGKEWTII